MTDETLLGVVLPRTPYIREEILDEAGDIIVGDRQKEYGPPSVNFQRIADILKVLFPDRDWTPSDVALMMIALKLGRTPEGYKRDTAVDLVGYAALWAELSEEGL